MNFKFSNILISKSTISKSIGAHGLMFVISMFFQIVSIPILLDNWGVDLYSDWIVLTSVTSYFAMSDIGLGTVTSNEFTMLFIQNKYKKCNILINNTIFIIVIVFLSVMAFLFVAVYLFNLSSILKMNSISENSLLVILFLFIFQVFVGMLGNLFDAMYRAANKNHKAVMINNCVKSSEFIILIFGAYSHLSLKLIVALYSLPILFGLLYKIFNTRKYFDLRVNKKFLSIRAVSELLMPSISFVSFPLGHSILLQGFTILINSTLGSRAVVTFNTTRTFVNFIKLASGILQNSFWPSFSMAYGKSDIARLRYLHRNLIGGTFYLAIIGTVSFLFFGQIFFTFWINSTLDFILLLGFLVSLTFSSIWYSSSVFLQSTNNHMYFSKVYLGSCIFSLFAAAMIIQYTNQISLVSYAYLVVDFICAYIVIKETLNLTQDSLKNLFKWILQFPFSLVTFFSGNIEKKVQ